MDKKILIANLKEVLKEINLLQKYPARLLLESIDEDGDTIKHLIEKTIKDLEKKPYVKSYQLTAVWSDGVLEQYVNIPQGFAQILWEMVTKMMEVSR